MDIIAIVCAIEPDPSLELIDHYIVAAENLSASTVIVVNKIDITDSAKIIQSIKNKYKCLPYPVFETSINKPKSLEKLLEQLKNHTCTFVGQSGVGKSTLISTLIPTIEINSQPISTGIQQGKHTTSVTTLYDLPQGGELIDSPGVRDFLFPKLDKEKITAGFYEIYKLGKHCKYHNCAHLQEPNCAVKNALDNGEISSERYVSYKKMMEQYG